MPTPIDKLREEHRNIEQLLGILEQEIDILANAGRPDYDVILGIADYFTGFPDLCHHPKENVIFERLRKRSRRATAAIDLESEHQESSRRVDQFHNSVHSLLKEAEIARVRLVNAAREFIEAERDHMKMEEEGFFRVAEEKLTAEDWSSVSSSLGGEADPVFDTPYKREFETLREWLVKWSRDNRKD